MHTFLHIVDILATILTGLGLIFLIVSFLRWLFSSSRSHRLSKHDKAATLFFLLKNDADDDKTS